MSRLFAAMALALIAITNPAIAGLCDYRPSQLVGGKGAAVVIGGSGAAAAVGGGAKAAGVYTLVHATSGATMMGGTWAGASAAGTAGIIKGTAGVIGSTAAIVTAPATIAIAGVTAVSVGAFEGACYFTDTRITDYNEIAAIVSDIAKTAPEADFRYTPATPSQESGTLWIRSSEGGETYDVKDLYVENGVLKLREWGPNRIIGVLAQVDAILGSEIEAPQ